MESNDAAVTAGSRRSAFWAHPVTRTRNHCSFWASLQPLTAATLSKWKHQSVQLPVPSNTSGSTRGLAPPARSVRYDLSRLAAVLLDRAASISAWFGHPADYANVTISQDPGTLTARWSGKGNSIPLDTSTAHEQNEIAQNTHTLYTRNHMIIQVHRMTMCTRDYDDTRIYTYTCRI